MKMYTKYLFSLKMLKRLKILVKKTRFYSQKNVKFRKMSVTYLSVRLSSRTIITLKVKKTLTKMFAFHINIYYLGQHQKVTFIAGYN